MLTKKEKKEIGLILGAVLLVAVVGLFATQLMENKVEAIAGAAVQLDPNLPTYSGMIILLKEYCSPVSGNGNCNALCQEKTCLPLEDNCDISIDNNQCLCCSSP